MSIYAAPTNETAAIALHYHRAGLAVLPLRLDGTKAPLIRWAADGWRRYEWAELAPYFNRPHPCGIGVICGRRSKGLEAIDFDCHRSPSVYREWASLVASDLLSKLVIVATPSGGRHVWYRSMTTEPSKPLARAAKNAYVPATPHATIELKSEGAYVVACGSPAETHPDNDFYVLEIGDPRNPPLLTNEERQQLHNAARALNLYSPQAADTKKPKGGTKSRTRKLAGDIFNAEADWSELLEPHGWSIVRTRGDGTTHWTRPDGTHGHTHATTNYAGIDVCRFYSDCPKHLNPDKSHSKFAVWTALNFDGDYTRAAKALRQNKHLSSGG